MEVSPAAGAVSGLFGQFAGGGPLRWFGGLAGAGGEFQQGFGDRGPMVFDQDDGIRIEQWQDHDGTGVPDDFPRVDLTVAADQIEFVHVEAGASKDATFLGPLGSLTHPFIPQVADTFLPKPVANTAACAKAIGQGKDGTAPIRRRPSCRGDSPFDAPKVDIACVTPFGFLNCDKPSGITSRDLVNIVQRRFGGRKGGVKVGHAGTLDPLAGGVLVVAVGPAVRLVPFLQEAEKRYAGSFRLGVCSDSGDTEQPLREVVGGGVPTETELREAAESLTGEIEQTPPAYSAVWVDGRRAYERVRQGERVQMPSRRVRVDEFSIVRYDYPAVDVRIVCGSGTYVRSLGIDLAARCGTGAVMTALVREAVGPFRLDEAVSIETLREASLGPLLRPPLFGVPHLPRLRLGDEALWRLNNGQRVGIDEAGSGDPGGGTCLTGRAGQGGSDRVVAVIDGRRRLRAIARREGSSWRPYRVFPSPD